MVLGHRESQLGHRLAPVREQALAESGIGPGPGDHARAVLGNPFFLGEVAQLIHRVARAEAARVHRGLHRVDALLHAGRALDDSICIGHGRSPVSSLRETTPDRGR